MFSRLAVLSSLGRRRCSPGPGGSRVGRVIATTVALAAGTAVLGTQPLPSSEDRVNLVAASRPAAPKKLEARGKDGRIRLTWESRLVGISGFRIYRDGSLLKRVGRVRAVSVGATNGRTRSYSVAAVDRHGNRSPRSKSVRATAFPARPLPPARVTASAGNEVVTIGWAPVASAKRYVIYRDDIAVHTVSAEVLGWVDAGRAAGVSAVYRVATEDRYRQRSALSSPVSATPWGWPTAPTGLVAAAGDEQVNLVWDAQPAAVGYHVFRDGTAVAEVHEVAFVDEGLVNGVGHEYQVQAEDALGRLSPLSAEVVAVPHLVTGVAPVEAVSGVSAQAVTPTSAELSWSAVADASGYRVERMTGSLGSWATVGTTFTLEFVDTNLSPETIYSYRVVALNERGDGPVSDVVGVNTAMPPAPEVVSASATRVVVQVGGVANHSGAETVAVLRASDPAGPFTRKGAIQTTGVEHWEDTSVEPNHTYYYRAVSVTGVWTTLASHSSPQVLTLDPVAGLAVVATSPASAELTWEPTRDASLYLVQRRSGTDGQWSTLDATATTAYQDLKLAPGNIHSYRVIASNDRGHAEASAQVSVNTARPIAPVVVSTGGGEVEIEAFGVTNFEGYENVTLQRGGSAYGPFTDVKTFYILDSVTWLDHVASAGTTYYRTVSKAGGWTSLPSEPTRVDTPAA